VSFFFIKNFIACNKSIHSAATKILSCGSCPHVEDLHAILDSYGFCRHNDSIRVFQQHRKFNDRRYFIQHSQLSQTTVTQWSHIISMQAYGLNKWWISQPMIPRSDLISAQALTEASFKAPYVVTIIQVALNSYILPFYNIKTSKHCLTPKSWHKTKLPLNNIKRAHQQPGQDPSLRPALPAPANESAALLRLPYFSSVLASFNPFSCYCPFFNWKPLQLLTRHSENGDSTSSSPRLINLLLRWPTSRPKILALRDLCSSSNFLSFSKQHHAYVDNNTFSSSSKHGTCSYLRHQRSLQTKGINGWLYWRNK